MQHLQKHGGTGGRVIAGAGFHVSPLWHCYPGPLESSTYEFPILYALYFDIHPCNGGGVYPTRYRRGLDFQLSTVNYSDCFGPTPYSASTSGNVTTPSS